MFPYAKDVDYKEQTLSFTLQFFDKEVSTNISISIPLDSNTSSIIEDLVNDEQELWND